MRRLCGLLLLAWLSASCQTVQGPQTGRLYSSWFSVKPVYPPEYYEEVSQQYRLGSADRPEALLDALAHRRIAAGMTSHEVELAWGPPQKVERSADRHSRDERWVYGKMPNVRYVYLTNGSVTSWEDSAGISGRPDSPGR